jgi:hypothetical protein
MGAPLIKPWRVFRPGINVGAVIQMVQLIGKDKNNIYHRQRQIY